MTRQELSAFSALRNQADLHRTTIADPVDMHVGQSSIRRVASREYSVFLAVCHHRQLRYARHAAGRPVVRSRRRKRAQSVAGNLISFQIVQCQSEGQVSPERRIDTFGKHPLLKAILLLETTSDCILMVETVNCRCNAIS